MDNQLIEEMTFREGSGCAVCPQLSVVELLGDQYHVQPQTMADMVVSRWRSGGETLESFKLTMRDFERIEETCE